MTTPLQPDAVGGASTFIGGLCIEDAGDRICIDGDLDIHRDLKGLADAELLLAAVTAIRDSLKAQEAQLPPSASNLPKKFIKNPV